MTGLFDLHHTDLNNLFQTDYSTTKKKPRNLKKFIHNMAKPAMS